MPDQTTNPCPHCGSFHGPKCPLVKAYEYHPDGTLKRVEFYSPSDYHPITSLKIDPIKVVAETPGPTHPRATITTWAGDQYVRR